MAAVKIVADGSIQGYTGYLSRPTIHRITVTPTIGATPRVPEKSCSSKSWICIVRVTRLPFMAMAMNP